MTQLIECIPNFSDARRPEVIDQIVAAIQSVSEVKLLDRSSDLDHNRTVVTFVGTPAGVEEAAFRAIKTASELIDLNVHTGAHPRMGATDVCPFVPLSDVTMEECIAIAQRLGQRVGSELSLPVYLYEAAATRPERANLENIRRGQYEGLKSEIESDPNRKPDFGPAKLGTAGATVIGARNPLIAFNVYLTTDDVGIAKKIAKVVRQSSGGLRYVKGLGLLVDGRAQVSMNLTNFRETPIARVVEIIRREAQRYGVGIHHSELVGLIPQEALVDAAVWYTQLDQFDKQQILESRLFDSGPQTSSASHDFSSSKPASFIDELASPTPTPGGGSREGTFSEWQGILRAGLGQEDDELVTAIAPDQICRTEVTANSFDGLYEYQVAHGMPEGVVDRFEIINIKEHHREHRLIAPGYIEFALGEFQQGAVIVNARQSIGAGKFFQIVIQLEDLLFTFHTFRNIANVTLNDLSVIYEIDTTDELNMHLSALR